MVSRMNRRGILKVMGGAFIAPLAGLARGEQDGPRFKPSRGDDGGKSYVVYDDKTSDFVPGGYMPDGKGVTADDSCDERPKAGKKCLRIAYKLEDNLWVGVAFLLDNQWEPKRKFDLYKALGARKGDPIALRFYVRSADGATAKFKVAGMKKDACKFGVETEWKAFGKDWELVEIDLAEADLSSLHGALTVILDREHNSDLNKPVVEIDLDQIVFSTR